MTSKDSFNPEVYPDDFGVWDPSQDMVRLNYEETEARYQAQMKRIIRNNSSKVPLKIPQIWDLHLKHNGIDLAREYIKEFNRINGLAPTMVTIRGRGKKL